MSMHVNLSPEMEGFVKGNVETCSYGSATDVIRDALRGTQAEDARVAAWKAALKVGDDQLDRGEGIAYTPDALKDITDTALSAMHRGQRVEPDVLP